MSPRKRDFLDQSSFDNFVYTKIGLLLVSSFEQKVKIVKIGLQRSQKKHTKTKTKPRSLQLNFKGENSWSKRVTIIKFCRWNY